MTIYCECKTCKYNDDGICNNFNDRIQINGAAECDSYIEKDDNNESE